MQQNAGQIRLMGISNVPKTSPLPMEAPSEIREVPEARAILDQLGGRGFLLMTGASNLFPAGRSETNPCPWLRMDLRTELQEPKTKVNRLKITLINDEYTVDFYHQELVDWLPVITNRQVFEMIAAEDLASLFTEVTGYDTKMPTIIFVNK